MDDRCLNGISNIISLQKPNSVQTGTNQRAQNQVLLESFVTARVAPRDTRLTVSGNIGIYASYSYKMRAVLISNFSGDSEPTRTSMYQRETDDTPLSLSQRFG